MSDEIFIAWHFNSFLNSKKVKLMHATRVFLKSKVIKLKCLAEKYFSVKLTYLFFSFSTADGKYLVLPSGELHIKEVGPEDGYKSYQCRTKHRLTGETRLSATKGRLVITGKCSDFYFNEIKLFQNLNTLRSASV